MRNLLKALGLLLLLITAQQGAVVHELSHYSASGAGGMTGSGEDTGRSGEDTGRSGDVNGTDVRSASGVAADANCAMCPAFAQVLTPAFSHAFQIPLLDRADVQLSPDLRVDAIETAAFTPRSRGPPSSS